MAVKAQLAYLRQVERGGRKVFHNFSRDLRIKFRDLGEEFVAITENTLFLRHAFASGDATLVDIVLDAFKFSEWQAKNFDPLWRKRYLQIATFTRQALVDSMGVEIQLNLPDIVSQRVIEAGGKQMGLLDLRADTRSALFKVLAEAREQNLGPEKTSRLIRNYVGAGRFTGLEEQRSGSGIKVRAETVARTEIRNAQAISVAELGREAGFDSYLAFDNLTGFDDDECIARDGQVFTYEEMLAENAAEHPNGTLSWAPVPRS